MRALEFVKIILTTIIFLAIVPGVVLLLVPYVIVSSSYNVAFYPGVFRYFAFLLWSTGTFVMLWCVWDFMFKGKGTPAPIDPPKELVAAGLYLYVRNPMYIGVLLILLGHILWSGSGLLILYAVGTFVCFHLFILFYEEPSLQKRFGESYKHYLQRVPRWVPHKPDEGEG
jgi:protein-S-isoprenylcysteine O-methyltransferase Ste14